MKIFQVGSIDKPRYYAGRRDMAVDGLHEAIVPLVHGQNVLDLGSGEGALAQRLRDAGHNVDESNSADFNVPGWETAFHRYDSVIAIEVIEHLKCPWRFIIEAAKLVRPGGELIISTPNIENPISKATFLLRGQYHLFRGDDLSYGHVSPLTEFQIMNMCLDANLQMVSIELGGTYPLIYIHRNLKDTVLWSLISIFGMMSKNRSCCKIYTMKKAAP
jgi:2-polyprenyl-3-methyl-5-hydroxy-6-metoxy-1,4-benzoquinol methylase